MSIPPWFTTATTAPTESRHVDVDGARIHYLAWNREDTAKPGLLFVHGFRAHARWWSFIAPFFVDRFRVVAIDLAGMGDSQIHGQLPPGTFPPDIAGVIEHAGLGPATLVGHSFGGGRVLRVCAERPDLVERAVVIDAYVPLPELPLREIPPLPARAKQIYGTYDAARARFRLIPDQPCDNAYVIDWIARHSLKEVDGGWSWKFDEHFRPRNDDLRVEAPRAVAMLARIRMPVMLMYGELSIVTNRMPCEAVVARLAQGRGPVVIPKAHHHVMLDQPLALVAALRAALA